MTRFSGTDDDRMDEAVSTRDVLAPIFRDGPLSEDGFTSLLDFKYYCIGAGGVSELRCYPV